MKLRSSERMKRARPNIKSLWRSVFNIESIAKLRVAISGRSGILRRAMSLFCVLLGWTLAMGSQERVHKAPEVHQEQIRSAKEAPVIDAHYTLEEALRGTTAPKDVVEKLTLIELKYWGMDHREHVGQLVAHRDVAEDLRAIFHELDSARFPIQSIIPIVRYNWDDDASIAVNNTSAFNYRRVDGTTHLSKHAYGIAVDLNPYLNPYLRSSAKKSSAQRPYNPKVAGTIVANSVVTKAFARRGWTWGGNWKGAKDYQHFDKR